MPFTNPSAANVLSGIGDPIFWVERWNPAAANWQPFGVFNNADPATSSVLLIDSALDGLQDVRWWFSRESDHDRLVVGGSIIDFSQQISDRQTDFMASARFHLEFTLGCARPVTVAKLQLLHNLNLSGAAHRIWGQAHGPYLRGVYDATVRDYNSQIGDNGRGSMTGGVDTTDVGFYLLPNGDFSPEPIGDGVGGMSVHCSFVGRDLVRVYPLDAISRHQGTA